MKTKKIAIFISSGPVGRCIVEEALRRGYSTTVIIGEGNTFNLSHSNIKILKGDVNRYEDVSKLAKNHDIIIYDQELKQHSEGECFNATRSIIMGSNDAGIQRLIISGHIHSINQSLNKQAIDAWRSVQEEQLAALQLLERQSNLDWSYFYTIESDLAKKSNNYVTGEGNSFTLITPNNEGKMSINEYAKTILDEVEKEETKGVTEQTPLKTNLMGSSI